MRPLAILAFAAGAAVAAMQPIAAQANDALPLVPVHGTVLLQTSPDRVILRNDAVERMLASQTHSYRLAAPQRLHSGEQIDAYVDRATSPWSLEHVVPGARYAVGQAFPDVTRFLKPGDSMPNDALLDQDGHQVRFSDFRGKTTLLTVIYTRCTDVCPVVTRKLVSLASQLSAARFHVVEMTLDPNQDSPAVLAAYAKKYGAIGNEWTFLTGEPNAVGKLLAQLGITSVRGGEHVTAAGDSEVAATDSLIDHSQPLVIVDPQGRIASIIQNAAISPAEIVAQARHDDGLSSNPFKRAELAAVSLVYSVCGGFFVGETTVAFGFWILVIGLPLITFALWKVGRHIFSE